MQEALKLVIALTKSTKCRDIISCLLEFESRLLALYRKQMVFILCQQQVSKDLT